ncbi:MAG: ATP-binding protein, partial [Candidatus Hydrogenedentota bacterium]
VILLTGCAHLETAAKAVEWGAFAYLQKPFRNQMIQTYVARAVARRRRNVERRNLERLALEANRFETLGRVISGMIHDLGSPLQVVSGYIDLMMASPELAPFRDSLETMQNQIQHCTDIVRSTMSFLRHQEDTLILLNLNEVVEACLNVAAPILRKQNVEVVRDLDAFLSFIQGDFVLVRQSVLNLITNACQAMEGQSAPQRLTFTTWNEDGYVCLGVEDTGPGVPDKDRHNVFQSFFSTKEAGGTGLGLSVVKNVLDKHGGSVEYGPRNEDTGAHFILRFPQHDLEEN